jgi:predicted nucleotidyltransferase
MRELIIERLKELSAERGIKILYACESGSRAWGFPSPDSDYDVRFIYAESLDWHLTLNDKKDTIDIPINDELDIGGWEIKKALNLLRKSNTPILEWIQSPIVYSADQNFLSAIQQLSKDFFSPISCMHHYLSMSRKYMEVCLGEDNIKLKRYFYALRTAMAGKWIRERGTVAPIVL